MHLGQGCGGERRLGDLGEQILERGSQLGLDDLPSSLEREGGDLVLQSIEFDRPVPGQDVDLA
jgi:hypothetical protein